MKFQVFHVNPGEKLKKNMLITILAILCQSFLIVTQLSTFNINLSFLQIGIFVDSKEEEKSSMRNIAHQRHDNKKKYLLHTYLPNRSKYLK